MFRTTLTGLVENVLDVERNHWLVPQAAGRCLRCIATADASIKLTGTRCLLGNVRTTHGTPSLSQHSTASVHPIGAGRQARKTAFDLLSATGGCSIKRTVPDIALNVTDNRSSNYAASVLRHRGGRSPYDDGRRIGEGPGAPHRELGILLRAALVSRAHDSNQYGKPSTDRLDLRKPGWNMGLHAPPRYNRVRPSSFAFWDWRRRRNQLMAVSGGFLLPVPIRLAARGARAPLPPAFWLPRFERVFSDFVDSYRRFSV